MDTRTKLSLCTGLIIFAASAVAGYYYSSSDKQVYIASRFQEMPRMNGPHNTSSVSPLERNHDRERRFGYITGAVMNPGLYAISEDARVYDLVKAAGGMLPEADRSQLNLAAPVRDGAHVHVKAVLLSSSNPRTAMKRSRDAVTRSLRPNNQNNLRYIYINSASAEELSVLPGIGPSLAQKIVEYRSSHGPFTSAETLLKVSGIGKAKLNKIRSLLRF